MKAVFCALMVLALSVFGADDAAGWKTLGTARKASGNCRLQLKTAPSYEVMLIQKGGRKAKLTITADGVTGQEIKKNGSTMPLAMRRCVKGTAPAPGESQDIIIKVRENDWTVYVDGALRGIMVAPFVFPGTFAVQEKLADQVVGSPKFLPVPPANFITNFMIEPGAPNELYPWNIQTGAWHLHTALAQAKERPETDQKRTKEAPLTADKSPNFYSLKGGGTNKDCVITTGFELYDDYIITAAMQPEAGEAGVVIYHRDEQVAEGAKPDPAKAEFYAFTIRMNTPAAGMNEVRLWQQKNGAKRVIARAEVPLYLNQWYLPGIAARGDEIICYLDHAELFRVREALPPGGKFGLFANTPKEIRMDDVTVKPFGTMDLESALGLSFNALSTTGNVTCNGKSLIAAGGKGNLHLDPASSIVVGRVHSAGQVFSALATPKGESWTLGAIVGWTGPFVPYLQYTIDHKPTGETYTLSRMAGGKQTEVLATTSLEIPWNGKAPENGEFDIVIDASQPGLMRCIKNGRVTLLWESPADLKGAFGLWTGNATSADFRELKLSDAREIFKELPQKNPVFQHDSFMRHWASPEGQWIAGKAKAMWHKGDFFSDYQLKMPCISGSNLSMAVPDDKDDGPVTITVNGNELTLTVNEWLQPGAKPQVHKVTLTPPAGKGVDVMDYTLFHEGQWLWITVDGKIVARQNLKTSLRRYGTRARVRGLNMDHLARTKVTRSNVIDEYFNESPFMWTTNGGDWQIINRFQCTPSWSHMIDEAYQTMGAFWRKQIFSGDMTLEFYAGSRQGNSYDLLGNYNCTMMASDATASTGYTATCTEWDHSQSQNWSRLYKNGKEIKNTNAYLAPRIRQGLHRRILNPLISQGRPYHGAWYYIKLRKIGEHIEYYFDDELIYSTDDKDVLTEGMVGIWTFMQSMTLAQIKITYDKVSPKAITARMLPLEEPKAPAPRNVTALASKVNGMSVDALAESACSVKDTVGQSTLTVFSADGADAQLFTNHLGAGDMMLSVKAPQLPLAEVAGWRFKVKRNERARFNAFAFNEVITDKGPRAVDNHFHHISGDTFDHDPWMMTGHTDVAPAKAVTATDDGWTEVLAWIPVKYRNFRDKRKRLIRFGGFGVEQQDELRNGIGGNGPGAAYAVAGLTAVRWDEPAVELAEGESFKAFKDEAATQPIAAATTAELLAALKASQKPGVNTAWLQISKGNRTVKLPVIWIVEDAKPTLTVAWDAKAANAVRITPTADYPQRAMAELAVTCEGEPLVLVRERSIETSMLYTFPMTDKIRAAFASGKVKLNVVSGKETQTFELASGDKARVDFGPVMVKLDGFTKFFCDFENGLEPPFNKDNRRWAVTHDRSGETEQGACLNVDNRGGRNRLTVRFDTPFSISDYPVAQFRYLASDMAQISLCFDYRDRANVRLASEDWGSGSSAVRLGKDIAMDEAWHSWTGIVTDAFRSPTYNVNRFNGGSLMFTSLGGHDQTGLFSWMKLDDVVFGPAVRTAEQLKFTPAFYDYDGVAKVQWAHLAGDASYHTLASDKQAAVKWTDVPAGQPVVPGLDGIAQGINHILVRAVDARGIAGHVIDLPYMLDTKPLEMSAEIIKSTSPHSNGVSLRIIGKTDGLSPMRIHKATFHVGKGAAASSMNDWDASVQHSSGAMTVYLNYPLIFRDLLDKSKNGDTFEFAVDNISDGAGNTSPRLTVPLKVDYSKDEMGPSWYEMAFGSSVGYFRNWDGRQASNEFGMAQYNSLGVVANAHAAGYLENGSYYGGANMMKAVDWKVARYPYLAMRLNRNVVLDKTVVQVALITADKATYVISLHKPVNGGNQLNRKNSYPWKNNEWVPFIFNVQDMLKAIGVPQEKINGMTVKSVELQRSGTDHRNLLRLDDFFIFGLPEKPAEPDLLKWTGYDASGVAGLEMTCVDEAGKDVFTHFFEDCHQADLNVLRGKFSGARWFRTRAKDKAGKYSAPCWIPVVGTAAPAPAAK